MVMNPLNRKGRSLNEIRQCKTYGYRNPESKEPSSIIDHAQVKSQSDIMSPVEWLAANQNNRWEGTTEMMCLYAEYYADQCIKSIR